MRCWIYTISTHIHVRFELSIQKLQNYFKRGPLIEFFIWYWVYISESRNNVVFCFSRKTSLELKFRLPSYRSFVFFCFLKIQSRRKISKYSFCITVLFFGPFLAHFRFNSQFQLREQLKKYFLLCKFGINHLSKKSTK